MAWAKKPIGRMEMLHLLGIIYAQTIVGFGKVALEKLIREKGKPTVKGKAEAIRTTLPRCGVLIYEKNGKGRRYKWNMQEWGPVSLQVADAVIVATEQFIRRKANTAHALKMKRINEINAGKEKHREFKPVGDHDKEML